MLKDIFQNTAIYNSIKNYKYGSFSFPTYPFIFFFLHFSDFTLSLVSLYYLSLSSFHANGSEYSIYSQKYWVNPSSDNSCILFTKFLNLFGPHYPNSTGEKQNTNIFYIEFL